MRAGLRLLERESKENEEKLSALRSLASEAFASLDRGERTTLEGEQQLADFIGRLGRRAAKLRQEQFWRQMNDDRVPAISAG